MIKIYEQPVNIGKITKILTSEIIKTHHVMEIFISMQSALHNTLTELVSQQKMVVFYFQEFCVYALFCYN